MTGHGGTTNAGREGNAVARVSDHGRALRSSGAGQVEGCCSGTGLWATFGSHEERRGA